MEYKNKGCDNCGSDTHKLEACKDYTIDYEDDEKSGCGCSLLGGLLLTIAASSILYAASYFNNSPQPAQPSKLEQGLAPKSNAKTLTEKCTEQAR